VVDYKLVSLGLGLTCDFWAENGKRKLAVVGRQVE
jgi:hypothetical protein